MGKADRLSHAKHNEEVCDYLDEKGDCPDWVVTTAFYAALHYAEHHLFPRDDQDWRGLQTFDTFDAWYRVFGDRDSKHGALRKLVQRTCPGDVSRSYRALLDASYTARYNHYRVPEDQASKARRDLARVRTYFVSDSAI